MELTFEVNHQNIKRTDTYGVVADSKNYLTASFSFISDEWAGVTKTAVFRKGDTVKNQILTNDSCDVPWEVIKYGEFTVSVFGGDLITVDVAHVGVKKSGYKLGDTPQEPTPDVYAQIIAMIASLHPEVDPEDLSEAIAQYFVDNPIDTITEAECEQIVAEYLTTHHDDTKVDKVTGKGLTKNELTDERLEQYGTAYEHSQSTHAPTDAQKNVQADWNQTDNTKDDYIKNKPSIPSPYTLPTAGSDTKGGVKIGANLAMNGEVLSAIIVDGEVITPVDGIVTLAMVVNKRYFVDGAISSLILTTPASYNPWDEFYIMFTVGASGCTVTPPTGWTYIQGSTSSFDANKRYEWDALAGKIACPPGTAVS